MRWIARQRLPKTLPCPHAANYRYVRKFALFPRKVWHYDGDRRELVWVYCESYVQVQKYAQYWDVIWEDWRWDWLHVDTYTIDLCPDLLTPIT